MASFQCNDCDAIHFPFGRGHLADVLASIGGDMAVPSFSLPIVASSGSGGGSTAPRPASKVLERELDALAKCLEHSTAGASPVSLPTGLRSHELPHWPTEISIAELAR